MLQSGCHTDTALTLEIPKETTKVVQYLPKDATGRNKNALYLPPREITEDEFGTEALHQYIAHMYTVMLDKAGVGIAANQLGKRLQIFIIEAKASNPRYKVLGPVQKQVFINPSITKVSTVRRNFWHGCLSAHGKPRGNVATYDWIEYKCQNEKGELQIGRLTGFAAVIFQHEFRHLLNGTYLDHATQLETKAALDKKLDNGTLPFFEITDENLPLLIDGYQVGETLNEYHERTK